MKCSRYKLLDALPDAAIKWNPATSKPELIKTYTEESLCADCKETLNSN